MMQYEDMPISKLIEKGSLILKDAKIDSYILDSRLLLGKVLNKDKLFIMVNREYLVSKKLVEKYFKLINVRKNKMPVKYILGKCEFMGIDFKISQGVLIPRPDTEILVLKAIEIIRNMKYKNVCDVCCGSGIIGISIAKFINNIKVNCLDISDKAIEITKENIKLYDLNNKVKVLKSDLLKLSVDNNKKYDIIVSNPPYIKRKIIPTLMDDVKDYEPLEALDGGEDGLYFYKKIINQSKDVINKGGMIIFEIGYDQKYEVTQLLLQNGFKDVENLKDLSGLDRVVLGRYY